MKRKRKGKKEDEGDGAMKKGFSLGGMGGN
jgi:hypothetical protein